MRWQAMFIRHTDYYALSAHAQLHQARFCAYHVRWKDRRIRSCRVSAAIGEESGYAWVREKYGPLPKEEELTS